MPRKEIDYSNTIIYKLCCKNPEIKDIYVGHTTDFTKRKSSHKSHCNNQNSEKYNYDVYKFIRDNGGWNNFDMVMVEQYSCQNRFLAEQRERYWLETLNATLNKVIPTRIRDEWIEVNKDTISEKRKIYNQQNKEHISIQTKIYYDNNKNYFEEKRKKYYNDNLKKIISHRSQKIECECGCEITRSNISTHKKSNKHLEAMKLKETES